MASSNSPCAACKFLRRKCMQGCVFAPYFPADNPQRFTNVHRVFGASNVAKLLNEISPSQREDAVSSLAYEAEARIRDPVYGCVGYISILQQKLNYLRHELDIAKKELCTSIGPAALGPSFSPYTSTLSANFHDQPFHHHHHHHMIASGSSVPPFAAVQGMGTGLDVPATQQVLLAEQRHQQQIATSETQEMVLAMSEREHTIYRTLEQHQEMARYNSRLVQMGNNGGSEGTMLEAPVVADGGSVASSASGLELVSTTQQHQF